MKREWTQQEEQYLIDNIDKYTLSAIANDLDRSYNSVLNKATRLSIHHPKDRRQFWTEDETMYLEHHYSKKSVEWIAMKLGRSEASVKAKARKLGLNAYKSEYLCVKQVAQSFRCDDSVILRWICKYNLKFKLVHRQSMTQRLITPEDFWTWADAHRALIPFSRYEKYSIIPEPQWLSKELLKAEQCKSRHRHFVSQVDKQKVRVLRNKGLSYDDIAIELHRTTESVKHIWRSLEDAK
jgi:hypothetical protein